MPGPSPQLPVADPREPGPDCVQPAKITWIGLAGYVALLVGGVGVFLLVRAFSGKA